MRDWDFEGLLARTLKISGIILVLVLAALAFRPGDPVLAGLAVGVGLSEWGAFFLGRRLSSITGLPLEVAKARVVAGCAVRMASVFAVLFLGALTGWYNICATAAGLFVAPCLFSFSAAGLAVKEARQVPGGFWARGQSTGRVAKRRVMQGR